MKISAAMGWSMEEQLEGVLAVLKEHTDGYHSEECNARVYECVEEVIQDLKTQLSNVTMQRDIEGSATLRLIKENQQLRALVHTLTGQGLDS